MPTQWDIWTVYWEHRDPGAETPGKARPGLLTSDAAEIAKGGDLRFMKISTKHYERVPDLRVDRSDGDEFACTGLRESPSYIHYTSVQTVSPSDLGTCIGYAGEATVQFLIDLIEEHKKARRKAR